MIFPQNKTRNRNYEGRFYVMEFKDYIGRSIGPQKIEYNWRDMALYALAVGAHAEDLLYTYENGMKALPSFGVVPYWNAVNNYPQRPVPYPASSILKEALERESGKALAMLHFGHELIMHKPIDPLKGSLIFEDTITNVYDRGEGKGILVATDFPVYDEAGNMVCENKSSTVFFTGGGFGGEAPPKSTISIPDGPPDYVVEDYISKTQNALYRLTGDTNHVHISPEAAKKVGFDRTFMQGLCSFGFACRMGIQAIIPGEPERMTRMAVQMRNVCYPDSQIKFIGWNVGEGKVVFQLVNAADNQPILDKCEFEYI